jgi:hypothetical protein
MSLTLSAMVGVRPAHQDCDVAGGSGAALQGYAHRHSHGAGQRAVRGGEGVHLCQSVGEKGFVTQRN